jgi:hypothetical protein
MGTNLGPQKQAEVDQVYYRGPRAPASGDIVISDGCEGIARGDRRVARHAVGVSARATDGDVERNGTRAKRRWPRSRKLIQLVIFATIVFILAD